ncbi:hypothetical protein [Nocardia gipuzkoensis]
MLSAYHQIFVRTDRSEAELIHALSKASGVTIEPLPAGDIAYGGAADREIVEVEMSHQFDDDFGMSFERYPVVVTIRDIDSDKERELAFARSLFNALSQLGDYHLLLAFNLQRRIAEI